ncbi:MAG: NAD(P)-binding protein [Methylacidiphilales bacterium]|nr:NAD(P)-binding protein [Candidatus Methylacidiphilales bacterium]
MKKPGPIAIIGAGISGLSCAQALHAAGVDVRLYERGPTVGGRCATRLWQGHLVDYGVQYFTATTSDFKRELLNRLRQFRPIISPVLDDTGTTFPSPSGPRFYVLQGNNYFAHVLSRGLDIRLNTAAKTISFLSSGLNCLGETYRAVISSMPGPQTARLFDLARSPVDYEPCIVAFLEYAGVGVGLARENYARTWAGGQHNIIASFCENHKVGRIVGQKTVFVVQASPAFSREYEGVPPETYLSILGRENEELWRIPSGLLTAGSVHRWVFGRPQDGPRHPIDLPAGAFYCGDSRTDSTVENVWLDGVNVAREVLNHLANTSS